MEAHRVKNIVILILAFLNLFLLGMLVRHLWLEHAAQSRLEEELRLLCAAQGLELAEDLALAEPAPDTLSLSRSLEAEAAMAAFILEEEVPPEDQGGGIYSYTGALGAVRFRSNGSFDYTPAHHPVAAPLAFCQDFCETFGYQISSTALEAGEGAVTAVQTAWDTPIYNASVTFSFAGGTLQSLSGAYVAVEGSASFRRSAITRVTALVRFLDHRGQSGLVCNAVSGIRPVYELQDSTSPLRLAAKWELTTDTGRYYVDCFDGTVARG